MTLHTMFYSNEIRAAESVPTDKVEVKRPGEENWRCS